MWSTPPDSMFQEGMWIGVSLGQFLWDSYLSKLAPMPNQVRAMQCNPYLKTKSTNQDYFGALAK